ncbi:MAG TPA: 2Fe-2S iron-sulfur cluster-binding protein, partial [Candidatus Acidoferrum sp.]|nr:2Fe-2S iron-sulfur cluster-binding protein [Candidatus Acidoferrum sp.]
MEQHTPGRKIRIEFQPIGLRGRCFPNESLLDCARTAGAGLNAVCGGQGTCCTCRVRLVSGTASALSAKENQHFSGDEIRAGWRLACQAYPQTDCVIHVPAESMISAQRLQVESRAVSVPPDPPVKSYEVKIPPPSLSDARADGERLVSTLKKEYGVACRRLKHAILRRLSQDLRAWAWKCRVSVRGEEIISVAPASSRDLGLAVDLGTTKLAGYLVDLESGAVLSSAGTINPQISFGEDVITRISVAMNSAQSAVELQRSVLESLNSLAGDLCKQAGRPRSEILETVIAGNTAMHHLFLGLPVGQLAVSPFVPCTTLAMDLRAWDLGLEPALGGSVYFFANIAGFIGGDHTAALLAVLPTLQDTPAVVMDIGTNTEVSLVHGN